MRRKIRKPNAVSPWLIECRNCGYKRITKAINPYCSKCGKKETKWIRKVD